MSEPTSKTPEVADLIKGWRERANEYDRYDREAAKRKEYIIAAQQAGLACALRVCANELEQWSAMSCVKKSPICCGPRIRLVSHACDAGDCDSCKNPKCQCECHA